MSIESVESPSPITSATTSLAPASGTIDAAALRGVEMFGDLRADELAWIAAHSERVVLAPGELLLLSGQPAEWMFIGIEGTIEVRREQLGSSVPAYVFRGGDIAGVIPYSRMKVFVGNGRAATHAVVARFPKRPSRSWTWTPYPRPSSVLARPASSRRR